MVSLDDVKLDVELVPVVLLTKARKRRGRDAVVLES
jgi:hypothetical protein